MTRAARGVGLALVAALAPLAASAYGVSTTGGHEIKWSVRSETVLINAASGPAGAATAIQAAMNTWSAVAGADFQFTYAGTTTKSGAAWDGANVCSFGNLGSSGGILAQNTYWAYPDTGQMIESDIVFNTAFTWSVSGAADRMDLQGIATHELGHALSLSDLYGAGDTEKTMYGYSRVGETKKRTLEADDIAGLVHLYPYAPAVTLSLAGSPLPEAGGAATVTATLSGVCPLPVTVNLAFAGTATLTSDYTRSGASITIPAWSLSGALTLTAVQDAADEPDESVTVEISTVVNGTESGTQQVTATVADDDPPPTRTLTVVSAQGGASPGTLTTNMGAALSLWVTNSPALAGAATQQVCTAGSVAGNAYAADGPTHVTLTLTNNATLTWHWQTRYRLAAQANGGGSVTPAEGWHAAGTQAVLVASAGAYWRFTGWSGDLGGCAWAGNVLTAAMTQARAVVANFSETVAPLGTPELWLASHGLTAEAPAAEELMDRDGDGLLAWQEYEADTDPTNRASVLRVTGVTLDGGTVRVAWQGGQWARQYIDAREELGVAGAAWQCVLTNDVLPTLTTNVLIQTGVARPRMFYRVRAAR